MADDDIDDLLEQTQGMDDLDNVLFGRPSTAKKKPQTGSTLSSMLSSGNANSTRKPTVSFFEPTSSSAAPTRAGPAKSVLDDLFGDSNASEPKTSSAAPKVPRQSRIQQPASSSDIFGSRRADSSKSEDSSPEKAPTDTTSHISSVDQARIQRLESEIEKLNRELEDLKRRKRDDEEQLERVWKDKIEKLTREHSEYLEKLKEQNLKQLQRIEEDGKSELERLKVNYDRQLESLTTTTGQTRDIISVVDKVDLLSSAIGRIADNVSSTSEKVSNEQEYILKLREQNVQNREEKLAEDKLRFEEERQKVHELNIRLNELCKNQENTLENDKWKVRDEWRKLQAERQLFKEDQRYVLESLERQKENLEKKKTAFFQEQHDLLVRVTSERQNLEQEKTEFISKRNLDVRRIKEEAAELDYKVRQVAVAERHVEDIKSTFEAKLNQLQELEISLMEECTEMDRIRNQIHASSLVTEKAFMDPQILPLGPYNEDNAGERSDHRVSSVRAVLRKHSEFLDKYVGQKVATVAPHHN